jgi:hypothetical protein
MGSGNPINHGASARRKSADSPADGVNLASGPTGKTDSGESVSDSETEGKASFCAQRIRCALQEQREKHGRGCKAGERVENRQKSTQSTLNTK